ncbi:hypothetical protein [Microvirga alba]|uniref:Uncharacterized protein n=1 Tax=Microvirga alba TaxID=2791025 RepID=A0A931BRF9_9HYPH|nr:hypothetical protein [Microvirga alba]MBF9234688.1 hypothetical protein [Microvirga alba]
MSKTKSELITEALQELNALGAGQVASAEDIAAVDARVQPLLEDLASRNAIYIGDADDIPDSTFPHLVVLLAEACAKKFGRPRDTDAITLAENRLRTLARIGSGTRKTLAIDSALRPRRRLGGSQW